MKKIRILTLVGDYNIGNKLQNYALVYKISKLGKYDVSTVWNVSLYWYLRRYIKLLYCRDKRKQNFIRFSKKYTREKYFIKSEKANYIIGSDQVWNYNFANIEWFLGNKIKNSVLNSYAASFGKDNIPNNLIEKYRNGLNKFKNISVREYAGKEIIKNICNRDVEVLVDPTMLLTSNEWDKISKRPKELDKIKNEKYILNYFLGELSEKRKKEIEKIAKSNDCHIINILDKNDPFYKYGPREFLYLEKNAFLICTDSFHSCVFSFLFDRPFIIFDREDNLGDMSSRLDTLLNKFNLKDRKYNGKSITKENLEHDYTESYKILDEERKKGIEFLKKILEEKECD